MPSLGEIVLYMLIPAGAAVAGGGAALAGDPKQAVRSALHHAAAGAIFAAAAELVVELDAGANAYLTKPFALDQLLAHVRNLLSAFPMLPSLAESLHSALLH